MKKSTSIPDPTLVGKSDEELVSDARMLVAELSKLNIELRRRDIESYLPEYEGGEIRAEYTRVKRERL